MKKLIGLILLVVIALAGVIVWHNTKIGNTKTPITIGFIGPLSGDAASFGLVEKRVIEIARDEINDAGGVNGRPLEFIFEDGKCTGKDAVSAAQKLLTVHHVNIILSDCSSETLAVAPLAEENKKVLITAYASNPDITNAGEYVFRNSFSDADTAALAAQTMAKDVTRVGILTELTSYPVGIRDEFIPAFTARGGEVFQEDFLQGSKDVRTQLVKLMRKGAQAIFINPDTPAAGIAILKELKELNFTGARYGNFFGGSSDTRAEEVSNGLIFFADPEPTDRKKALFEKYKDRFGEYPNIEYPAASRYDTVYIIQKAIEAVGSDDADAIKTYLLSMPEYEGLVGTYYYDEHGDAIGITPSIKQIIDGKTVSVQ